MCILQKGEEFYCMTRLLNDGENIPPISSYISASVEYKLPSTQLLLGFININYMAACFDQNLVIFRPVGDIRIKLQLQINFMVRPRFQSSVQVTC